jgi:hypothetical protein
VVIIIATYFGAKEQHILPKEFHVVLRINTCSFLPLSLAEKTLLLIGFLLFVRYELNFYVSFTSALPLLLKRVKKKVPAAEHPSVLPASQHQETHPKLGGSLLFSESKSKAEMSEQIQNCSQII